MKLRILVTKFVSNLGEKKIDINIDLAEGITNKIFVSEKADTLELRPIKNGKFVEGIYFSHTEVYACEDRQIEEMVEKIANLYKTVYKDWRGEHQYFLYL
jgi:hypothetical protein